MARLFSSFFTRCAAGALTALLLSSQAGAQPAWPSKPVRLVVPYAAGGTTDYAGRQVAQKLTELLGQSFFVENKAGGSGTIGTQMVVRSAADGATFLVNDTAYTMLPALFAKLPWNHATDLVPVTTLVQTPVILVVPSGSPFKTLQDFLAHARQQPGKLNFGSGGTGSSAHLQVELFNKEAGISVTHVPYKGAGEAMLGLMAGQVDMLISATPTAIPQVRSGKVRALAVTGNARLAALSDVPTFAEAGVKGYGVMNWFGLAAPKGTPAPIIERMQKSVVQALADPALRARLADQGAQPGGMASTEFAKLIRSETQQWTEAARVAGIQPQ